jgi:hypothetical protein
MVIKFKRRIEPRAGISGQVMGGKIDSWNWVGTNEMTFAISFLPLICFMPVTHLLEMNPCKDLWKGRMSVLYIKKYTDAQQLTNLKP